MSRSSEIEARLAAATPGEWGYFEPAEAREFLTGHLRNTRAWRIHSRDPNPLGGCHCVGTLVPGHHNDSGPRKPDVALIAHAPSDIRHLLAENRRLRGALGECIDLAQEGWSYAGDYFRDKWSCEDRIAAARAALEESDA